jgi:hypothetical protein
MRVLVIALLLALSTLPAKADIATWIGTHRALCFAYFGLHPENERLPNIPVICNWRPADYYCRPEQNPPAGWLRPGGFCEVSLSTKSLVPTGSGSAPPEDECPVPTRVAVYEPEPCYPE